MKTEMTNENDDLDYLKRMGCENADEWDVANAIVKMITTKSEDEYYATKYGKRMIRALVEIKCKERGCIW